MCSAHARRSTATCCGSVCVSDLRTDLFTSVSVSHWHTAACGVAVSVCGAAMGGERVDGLVGALFTRGGFEQPTGISVAKARNVCGRSAWPNVSTRSRKHCGYWNMTFGSVRNGV
uniref:Uncharacterized protein n=1 Tax=Trypanosoma vivax (strain Y486) TaxID=1055687 RepID=G0UAC6_TRYVY|nr:hypothetical protein TVY486_1102440 [Trypanosoma vivax Y486]